MKELTFDESQLHVVCDVLGRVQYVIHKGTGKKVPINESVKKNLLEPMGINVTDKPIEYAGGEDETNE